MYAATARTRFNGALESNKNGGDAVVPDGGGASSVSTAMIGLRHRFEQGSGVYSKSRRFLRS